MSLPILKPPPRRGLFFYMCCKTKKYLILLFLTVFTYTCLYTQSSDTSLFIGSRYSFNRKLTLFSDTSIFFSFKQFYLPNSVLPLNTSLSSYKVPKSAVYFVSGSKKETALVLNHTQTIKQTFDFNFYLNQSKHLGFYQNDASALNTIGLNSRLRLFHDRLFVFAQYHSGKSTLNTNGGVDYPDLSFADANKENIPVHLNSAKYNFKNSRIKGGIQWNKTDSIDSLTIHRPFFVGYFYTLDQIKTLYQDQFPNFSFYNITDSTTRADYKTLYDSTSFFKQRHQAFLGHQSKNAFISAFVNYDIYRFSYFNMTNTVKNNLGGLQSNDLSTEFQAQIKARDWRFINQSAYSFSGFTKQNYSVFTRINYQFQKMTLEFSHSLTSRTPEYQSLYAHTSLYQYQNNFLHTKNNSFLFKFNYSNILQVSVNHHVIKNYIFYTAYNNPLQFTENIQYLSASARLNYKYKALGISGEVCWQDNNHLDVLPLPKWIANMRMFIKDTIFKKTLLSEFGVNAFYFSSYFAPTFMPLNQQFILQNTSLVGDYPVLGLYVSFYVKNFSLTLSYSHLNQGFMNSNYEAFSSYFQQDRNFRFIIRWDLWN